MARGNMTSKRAILAAEHRVRSMDLRRKGKSYTKIGKELGISPQRVHKIVSEELKKLHETLDEETRDLKELELQRLDDLYEKAFESVEEGHIPAIDRCIKIMERRAKLLGLDMPEKLEFNDVSSQEIPLTPEVLAAQNALLKAVSDAQEISKPT